MGTDYDNIILDTTLIEDINPKCNTRHENDIKHPKAPGRQIGLYNEGTEHDVKQMVEQLNNPGESGQDDRG